VTDPSTDHHVIRTPDLAQLQIEMRIDVGRMKPTHPNRRQVSQLTTGQHLPRHAQRDAVSSHPGGVASSGFAITVRIGNRTGDRSICAIVRILGGRYDWSRAELLKFNKIERPSALKRPSPQIRRPNGHSTCWRVMQQLSPVSQLPDLFTIEL